MTPSRRIKAKRLKHNQEKGVNSGKNNSNAQVLNFNFLLSMTD
jgi:hypothetical protein